MGNVLGLSRMWPALALAVALLAPRTALADQQLSADEVARLEQSMAYVGSTLLKPDRSNEAEVGIVTGLLGACMGDLMRDGVPFDRASARCAPILDLVTVPVPDRELTAEERAHVERTALVVVDDLSRGKLTPGQEYLAARAVGLFRECAILRMRAGEPLESIAQQCLPIGAIHLIQ